MKTELHSDMSNLIPCSMLEPILCVTSRLSFITNTVEIIPFIIGSQIKNCFIENRSRSLSLVHLYSLFQDLLGRCNRFFLSLDWNLSIFFILQISTWTSNNNQL